MKIVDIRTQQFNFKSSVVNDSEGHTHPGPEHDATQTLLTIVTDEGAEGYGFGASRAVVEGVVKPALLGEDPMYREKLWQLLSIWPYGTWLVGIWDNQCTSC